MSTETVGEAMGVEESIWTTFVSFTFFHAVTVGVCAAMMIAACRMGLLWRGTEREVTFRHWWGWSIVVVKTLETVYWFWPGVYRLEDSLPLQLCDLAAVMAAVAMLTHARWARTLLYFWAIGLSTQAFATPTLEKGLGSLHYWFFWTTHLMVVGSAVYDLVVGGYRPHLKDVGFTSIVSLGYAGAVTVLNLSMGTNYGYIGNATPERPTLIDRLGPWPERVFIVIALVGVLYVVLWAVWPAGYWLMGRRYPQEGRDDAAPRMATVPMRGTDEP